MKNVPTIKINGRKQFFNRIVAVTKVRRGHYEVTTECHGTFHVEGGKAAGGTRRDWFLDGEPERGWHKTIPCTSLVDALRCIDGM